ncbi:MAG: hypothetical protein HY711_06225 [Candidatus Melainabacteria bacterium]|nr:hypothetical protein [Candidatus Melainabacteria bacterium]
MGSPFHLFDKDTLPANAGSTKARWPDELSDGKPTDAKTLARSSKQTSEVESKMYSEVAADLALAQGTHDRSRVGPKDERTQVRLFAGDTFWELAGRKYNGHHAVDAIYEANGLSPLIVNRGGKPELVVPGYKAGTTYVLPADSEIPELSRRYWLKMSQVNEKLKSDKSAPVRGEHLPDSGSSGKSTKDSHPNVTQAKTNPYTEQVEDARLAAAKHDRARVGLPDERTQVRLGSGDTFWELSGKKYNGRHPIDAIYEANGLTPTVVRKAGRRELIAPTYWAGQTYVLPAESEIPELSRRFWQKMDIAGGKPGEQGTAPGKPAESSAQSQPKEPAVDLVAEAEKLQAAHTALEAQFAEEYRGQGSIGQLWDSIKGKVGASESGRTGYDPRSLWAHVVSWDSSSTAVMQTLKEEQGKIDKLKQAAQAHDAASFGTLYQQLTGAAFAAGKVQPVQLKLAGVVTEYRHSQANGVETITDISAGLASGLTLACTPLRAVRSMTVLMGAGAGVGSLTKTGLKLIDGRYANPQRDLIMGAVWGGTLPLAELAGARASHLVGNRFGLTVTGEFLAARLETQGAGIGLRLLSAATKGGTAGGVFGALESPTREALSSYEQVHQIDPMQLLRRSAEGGALGFIGGTLFGLTFDGLADGFRGKQVKPFVPPKPEEINGVPVPPSGVASLEDAAKMLGKDPAELTAKAANDPFGAVGDAVALYEKAGVNVQKVDPLTGSPSVPPQFAEALGLVQSVDTMTPGANLSLSKKVGVVRSADEYVSTNRAQVDASMEKLHTDTNFQEVVRLKTDAHGAEVAQSFVEQVRGSLEKDLKIRMSVERVNNPSVSEASAFETAKAQSEVAYLQKAADFFKDMTDPAQRARLNALVDEIFEKFTPRPITPEQLEAILGRYSESDRKLAIALLEHSMPNCSDVGLKAQLQALRAELTSRLPGGVINNPYALQPDSSGNLLGYLFRKSNSTQMPLRNLDHLEKHSLPQSIVLFDDLANTEITQTHRELLAKIPEIYVADLGSFEKGLNLLDFAQGPEKVVAKLDALVAQARTVQQATPELLPHGVAQQVLNGAVDESAKTLGANVVVVRPTGKYHVTGIPTTEELAAMDPLEGLYRRIVVPKASKDQIASFLTNYVGEERELAARMLKEGAVNNSFVTMVAKAKSLYEEISKAVKKPTGQIPLRMVVDQDPGGSTHLITYLVGKVNHLPRENFISAKQLNDLIVSGGAHGKVIAYLDDTVYSGSQATSMLQSNIAGFMKFDRVVIGSLGAYEKGISAIGGTHLASVGKVKVAAAEVHHPFYSGQHPFFGGLSAGAQAKVQSIGGSGGFGNVQGSLIWAYMYPDNNLEFFGSRFAGGVLKLPGS